MASDPLFIGFIILTVMVLVLLALVIWQNMRMKKFLIGFDSHNISESLAFLSKGLTDIQSFRKEMEKYLGTVEKRLNRSIQAVHTMRFNPFKGVGGGSNQSFATAFLSEKGDGTIISSLYSRDHVSIFSKPVKNNTSEYELSEEEKVALEKAQAEVKVM